MSVHFSSKSDEWATPQDFYDKLNAEFCFTLDAAARPETAKCPQFFTAENSALDKPWQTGGAVFCNPPYSRGLQAKFIRKGFEESNTGKTVVFLIPARPDTAIWHDVIFPHAEVRFVRGRIKFSGHKNAAPFPCAVVIFRPKPSDIMEIDA
jgi:phage N-6-adenine-methyltransferase